MDTSANALKALLTEKRGRKSNPAQAVDKTTPGHFDSKLGTLRRSRKGRTYRAPNGYVTFVPDWDTVSWHKGLKKLERSTVSNS